MNFYLHLPLPPFLILILSLIPPLDFCNEMNLSLQDVGQSLSTALCAICSITATRSPDWVPKPLIKTRSTFHHLINTSASSGLCRWICVILVCVFLDILSDCSSKYPCSPAELKFRDAQTRLLTNTHRHQLNEFIVWICVQVKQIKSHNIL